MPPKKSTTPSKTKAAAAAPAHGSYIDMVKDAIVNLKDRNGSSRQAIQKYILANNKLGNLTDAAFKSHVNRAISSGEEKGDFTRPKGTSGPVKLAKKEAKPVTATATKKVESKTEKKPAEKKTEKKTVEKKTTEKKAPATKKTTTKTKATATKAAPKKTATVGRPKKTTTAAAAPAAKPKANASKPRKTAAAPAPAVEEEVSRVLGKTKSGRVTKTTAPAAPKATKKAPAAAKKTAAAKKATTPKKKATPKKATPKTKA